MASASVRVDKWLWSVRLFKTRTQASKACDAGQVRIGDDLAKAAKKLGVGDRVTVRKGDRIFIVEVVMPLEKRVSAPKAEAAYIDHSPPYVPPESHAPETLHSVRDRGEGRPTKRERREIDRLRGRR